MMSTTQLMAAPSSLESCLGQPDKLDREYCQKKRIRSINRAFNAEFATYQKGYSQAQKNQAIGKMNTNIAAKKAQIAQLTQELKVTQVNLSRHQKLPSHEENAAAKKNSRREKRKRTGRKVKKFFKKIF